MKKMMGWWNGVSHEMALVGVVHQAFSGMKTLTEEKILYSGCSDHVLQSGVVFQLGEPK